MPARVAAALLPGAVLDAVVVARSGPDVTLELGGARVQTRSALPLPGDRPFPVQVRSSGSRLVLEVIDPAIRDQAVRAEALRSALPRQLPLEQALQFLGASRGSAGAPSRAGARATAQVEALLRAIPDAATLSRPNALARAIQDSGLLLEAKLARAARGDAPPRVEGDLKALVLRALAIVTAGREQGPRPGAGAEGRAAPQPAPAGSPAPPAQAPAAPGTPARAPEGSSRSGAPAAAEPGPASRMTASVSAERALEGALGRVQSLQIASSDTARADGVHWHVEIPVRHGERVHTLALTVTRDDAGDGTGDDEGQADEHWSVDLGVDLGPLGMLHGRVTLAGRTVNAALWASERATATLVESRLGALAQGLEAAGLEVGRVLLRPGAPPSATDAAAPGSLLRERA